MVCSHCGHILQDQDRFCCMCGTPAPIPKPKARRWPAVLALVLIFAFGFSVFWLTHPQPGPVTDDTMPWFTLQDGILYFDATRYTGSSELTVPETIDGQTVTAVSDECFADCTELIMIHLPETVQYIGEGAFYGCSSLRGMKLPESLVSIGSYAFSGCVNLEAVCIPYSLERIGGNPFYQCNKLVYFFYPGPLEDWYDLPLGNLRADSYVYCADGVCPAK
ncbi:MAG: leucine-rich repeat protein [Oscillospiraceae bacterium]|nr:leucine-rich repeat protein [Oscillospiraceae bacterium]